MFADRRDAGVRLAEAITDAGIHADVVLAIPRGGLPIGRAVADALDAPLDIVAARKLGAPDNPELAIGAVSSDGGVWLNESILRHLGVDDRYIQKQIEIERKNALTKEHTYRAGESRIPVAGKTVVVVDDGMATGATAIACVRQVRTAEAGHIVLAVPVASRDAVARLEAEADSVVAVSTPRHFGAVGQYYDAFSQVSDREAMTYLRR